MENNSKQDNQAPVIFYKPGACSFGSIVVAEWMNLPYQLCRIENNEQLKSEAFLAVNPLGQVGALKTKDGFVAQNAAILLHLAASDMKAGFLHRPGTPEFDHTNQCLSYLGTTFHEAFVPFLAPQKFSKDEAAQKSIKEMAVEGIRKQYKNMDITLKDKEYLVADKKGIVDAYFYGLGRWGINFKVFENLNDYPNVAAFLARMEKDPAVKFALEIEKNGDAKTTGKCLGHIKLDDAATVTAKAA